MPLTSMRNDSSPDACHLSDNKRWPTSSESLVARLQHSFISRPAERMTTLFLEDKAEVLVFDGGSPIVTLAMSEALARFVTDAGGEIIYTTALDRHESDEEAPSFRSVTICGQIFRILTRGWVFLIYSNQRVVVQIFRVDDEGGSGSLRIRIHCRNDPQHFLTDWKTFTRNHGYCNRRAVFADGNPIEQLRTISWEDVILSQSVKQQLLTNVEVFLKHFLQFRAAGLKTRRGVILAGPPGTGKTLIGKVIAGAGNTTMLWVLPRHLQSTEDVATVVAAARFLSPTILFFEDLDLIGEDRDSSRSSLLGELMNQLDGASENDGIVSIATTNRLEVIEGALRNRPGRFDRVIEIGLPDGEARRQLLMRLLRASAITEVEIRELSERSDGLTPAQLEEAVNTAFLLTMESSAGDPGKFAINVSTATLKHVIAQMNVCSRAIGF